MNKFSFIFLFLILSVFIVSSVEIDSTNSISGVNINIPTIPINFSNQNVNNSEFLQGFVPADFWQIANAQTGITGDKSGSLDFVTSGEINASRIFINRVSSQDNLVLTGVGSTGGSVIEWYSTGNTPKIYTFANRDEGGWVISDATQQSSGDRGIFFHDIDATDMGIDRDNGCILLGAGQDFCITYNSSDVTYEILVGLGNHYFLGGNVLTNNNVSANFFKGDGSLLTGIVAGAGTSILINDSVRTFINISNAPDFINVTDLLVHNNITVLNNISGGGLVIDTDGIFYDPVNKRFAVGTVTPNKQFEVFGSGAGVRIERTGGSFNDPAMEFRYNDGGAITHWDFFLDGSADQFIIRDRGTGSDNNRRLIIDGKGNVNVSKNLTVEEFLVVEENATFEKDVIIDGFLYGGSPVKIAGINITNNLFSLMENKNSSLDFILQNLNEGSNATSIIITKNDVGSTMGIGVGSSNFMIGLTEYFNVTALFSRARGDMVFANFFNKAFVWLYNPSDDNDPNNLVEIMRLDSAGLNISNNTIVNQNFTVREFFFLSNDYELPPGPNKILRRNSVTKAVFGVQNTVASASTDSGAGYVLNTSVGEYRIDLHSIADLNNPNDTVHHLLGSNNREIWRLNPLSDSEFRFEQSLDNSILTINRTGVFIDVNLTVKGILTVLDDFFVDGEFTAKSNGNISGEFFGSRQSFVYGDIGLTSGDDYLFLMDTVQMSSTIGYRMLRSGSIVGHSTLINIIDDNNGDMTFEVRINDVNQASLETEFLSSLGTGVKSDSVTFARHNANFVAGDIIQIFAQETGQMSYTNAVGYFEVQFNN